jgi:hypothetical protein
MYPFISKYRTLREVLNDQKLAALGDPYTNLVYSLVLSKKRGTPTGGKVDNRVLSGALRKADLREFLPRRTTRHRQADAAEALLVYAWMRDVVSLDEMVNILERHDDAVEAFCSLLLKARTKLDL